MSWVTAEGGAMDRVVVFCAALLGVCAVPMLVAGVVHERWLVVAVWAAALMLSGWAFNSARRRVRRSAAGPER